MTVNKRKKNHRQRGDTTHGWGSMKKRRGKGNKGGAGMAGTGKRGDAKKPAIWKNKRYFGKYGFKKKGVSHAVNAVNLAYIEEKLGILLEKKLAEKKGDFYTIEADKLGFSKVLGYGKPTKKYSITAQSFSKKAIEKIKTAGGEAVELKKKKAPKAKEAAEGKEENADEEPKEPETKQEESGK